jgi:hypothetical protein
MAKLTQEAVDQVLAIEAIEGLKHQEIATRISDATGQKVGRSTVSEILGGKTWMPRGWTPDLPKNPPDDKCEIWAPGEEEGRCALSTRTAEHHLIFKGATGPDDYENTARVCEYHHRIIHLEADEDKKRWAWNPKARALIAPNLKVYRLWRDVHLMVEEAHMECDHGLSDAVVDMRKRALEIVFWTWRATLGAVYQAEGWNDVYEWAASHGFTTRSTVKGYIHTGKAYFGIHDIALPFLQEARFPYRDLKNAAAQVKKMPTEQVMDVLRSCLDPQGIAIPGALPEAVKEKKQLPKGKVQVNVSGSLICGIECDLEITEDGDESGIDVVRKRMLGHKWVSGIDQVQLTQHAGESGKQISTRLDIEHMAELVKLAQAVVDAGSMVESEDARKELGAFLDGMNS